MDIHNHKVYFKEILQGQLKVILHQFTFLLALAMLFLGVINPSSNTLTLTSNVLPLLIHNPKSGVKFGPWVD